MPTFAESVDTGEVTEVLVKEGQFVKEGDLLAVIDIEKSTVELFADKGGKITKLQIAEGQSVKPKDDFVELDETAVNDAATDAPAEQPAAAEKPKASPQAQVKAPEPKAKTVTQAASPTPVQASKVAVQASSGQTPQLIMTNYISTKERTEQKEKMTMLRRMVANRLKASQNNNALLTTFNEIDMGNIIDMRKKQQDIFTKKHGIKLGFMGFFLKASSQALDCQPIVNSVIESNEIIHRNQHDISIAVSGPKGLLVPVVRDVFQKTVADVEKDIFNQGVMAREGKVGPDHMAGGTFTVSNGGIFGSMMGTPIVNPPQSAILGMHATNLRPIVKDGSIVARPMMQVALTYDHRLLDGKDAVLFLRKIKECIEEPERILLQL